jgi:hypothetical protein
LRPLAKWTEEGVSLYCADRSMRLCFPVLSNYIADMEEQWLLACMIKGSCPKCLSPRGNLETGGRQRRLTWAKASAPERTDSHAQDYRRCMHTSARCPCPRYQKDEQRQLSYHPNIPFTDSYVHGGILDALGPDLLHQVSKCFKDYLLDTWLTALVKIHAKHRGYNEATILAELDVRFMAMPTYRNLRRFHKGIFTQKHHWTVHEVKAMMKVIMGVLVGVCPTDGLELCREYLHIHVLAQHTVHSEETLGHMNSAIATFWEILKDPNRAFIRQKLVNPDWAPQRLHYMSHYAQSVRQKGALPTYSTDRTEPTHKLLKYFYRMSNKGESHIKYILTQEARHSGLRARITDYDASVYADGDPEDEDEDPPVGVESEIVATHRMAKRVRTGWPASVEDTVEYLALVDLDKSLLRYLLDRLPGEHFNDVAKVKIAVRDSVTVRYQPLEMFGADLLDADSEFIQECVRAGPTGHTRRDFVLISCPERMARRGLENAMTKRRVAQLVLLFTLPSDELWASTHSDTPGLAYVNWLNTVGGVDKTIGMYSLKRTETFSVVDVRRIERTVHVIPKFGTGCRQTKVNYDQWVRAKNEYEQLVKMNGEGVARDFKHRLDIVDYYNDFWLNCWTDCSMYNTVF